MTRPRKRNEAHRPRPPFPPIDPTLVYPWARLADWGFGLDSARRLKAAGCPVHKFGRTQFVRGADLIAAIESASEEGDR